MNNHDKEFSNAQFIKSSFSGVTKNLCVEVAFKGEQVAVRDSKDPQKTILVFNSNEWSAFVAGVKAGEFDV